MRRLLIDAFPTWHDLSPECAVRQAIERNQNSDQQVVETITEIGLRDAVIRGMRKKHPTGAAHHPEHDFGGLFGVMTEARAAAWAHRNGLGKLEFVASEGAPDLRFDSGWIEAKRLLTSDWDRAAQRLADETNPRTGFRMADPLAGDCLAEVLSKLVKKFDGHFEKAVSQWDRQGRSGNLIVYVEIWPDLRVPSDEAFESLKFAARDAVATTPGTRVVMFDHAPRTFDIADPV